MGVSRWFPFPNTLMRKPWALRPPWASGPHMHMNQCVNQSMASDACRSHCIPRMLAAAARRFGPWRPLAWTLPAWLTLRSRYRALPSLTPWCVIWIIMGTFFVIIFEIIWTKMVGSLTMAVRNLSKFPRNTIPKWSNKDHKWANTPLGGAQHHRGVCLVIEGLYLITSGLYFVEISTNSVPQPTNFVPNSSQLHPNDVQGPHDILCNDVIPLDWLLICFACRDGAESDLSGLPILVRSSTNLVTRIVCFFSAPLLILGK